jgi:DNA polymerase V
MEDTTLQFYKVQSGTKLNIPMFAMSVSAGVPVEADESIEKIVDLNELLIDHPGSTVFAKVFGREMEDVGIKDGDVLVIDTEIKPHDGRIVVVKIGDQHLVKYYRQVNGELYLESQNRQFIPIKLSDMLSYEIIGTVTKVIHTFA